MPAVGISPPPLTPTPDKSPSPPPQSNEPQYEKLNLNLPLPKPFGSKKIEERQRRIRKLKIWIGIVIAGMVVVLGLEIMGISLLVKDRRKATDEQDEYRTIGSQCRNGHEVGRWKECIFEREDGVGDCSKSACQLVKWKLGANETSMYFEPTVTSIGFIDTEKTHCGDKKWCLNRKCQSTDIALFKQSINFTDGAWNDDPQSPCFEFDKSTDNEEALMAWMQLRMTETCSNDMCEQSNLAKVSFRVQLQRCWVERGKSQQRGLRARPCKGRPLKIYHCKDCPGWSGQSEADAGKNACHGQPPTQDSSSPCVWKCQNGEFKLKPNGMECEKNRSCFLGGCYDISA